MILPEITLISGKEAAWTKAILKEWRTRVVPLFAKGETCERANYFEPRPWKNEYDRGSEHYGFTYTVNPGRNVAILQWR